MATRWQVSWGEARLVVLGGVMVGLAVALLPSGQPWTGAEAGPATGSARAVEVIDGDTFRMDGETIRIADIDTPELRGRCPHESALAARATARMRTLLAQGTFELHTVDRDTDRYGRKLRIVTRAGRSLGDQLVAEGLARTWTGRREPWC